MKKIKFCCFTVNTTHAYIIANNFINNKLKDIKVIYINEKDESCKIKNIISKFYNDMNDKIYYTTWLNEKIINDYKNENFVFVVSGKEEFIDKVNKYLDINQFFGYIINCYEIFDIKDGAKSIIEKHDYYINTTGIVKKEIMNNNSSNFE